MRYVRITGAIRLRSGVEWVAKTRRSPVVLSINGYVIPSRDDRDMPIKCERGAVAHSVWFENGDIAACHPTPHEDPSGRCEQVDVNMGAW